MGKHITFMGGTMRLSLFAAASVAVIAGFAPAAALAANECGDPSANGATADTFACTGTLAAISYPSTNGNLTLTLTNGPTVTTGGLSVTATGANTVTINRSDATAGAGDPSITNTGGAGIQATTGTGALALALNDSDTGDTPLTITGTSAGVLLQSGATTGTALSLTFNGGSIAATGANGVGVDATTTSVGAGNLSLVLGGAVSGATGVRATTNGTGGITVNLSAVSGTVLGGDVVGTNGAAILLNPSAIGNVTIGAGRLVRASNAGGAVIEVTNINATRNTAVNNSGTVRSNDDNETGYDDLIFRVGGGAGNSTISNTSTGVLQGRISLLNTGNATVSISTGIWRTVGVNTIGLGSSVGTLSSSSGGSGTGAGIIGTNASGAATSFVFGDGTDTFTNGGTLAMGEGAEAAATLTITGLETWSNAGLVLFGVNDTLYVGQGRPIASDGVTNDRIVAQGAAFVGTTISSPGLSSFNSSNFVMDVDFSADQADCSAAVTADCLDLRGGSVSGATPVDINVVGGGFAERLVLVDVAGAGTGTADAFTLSEDSDGYVVAGTTATIESGMFLYTLDFDATAKQYALVASEFGGRSLELARFGRAVTEPWRTATGLWHDRQADLRHAVVEGDLGDATGVWLKLAGNFITESGFATSGAGVEYETSADQRTTALVGGVDLLRGGGEGSAWVLGLTAGKLNSTLDFTARASELDIDGYSFGAYASLVAAGFFLDGIVNRTSTDLTHNDMGQTFDLSATSLGYQVEGGYRLFETEGGAYVEPLAAVSYVRADIDDLVIGPIVTRFDEATSLRGSLGLRFAGHVEMESMLATFSFTGRAWEELEGENRTSLAATYASASVIDAGPSSYGDVGVALGLFGLGDRFSANLSYGVKFAEDYQNTDVSFGFRVNW